MRQILENLSTLGDTNDQAQIRGHLFETTGFQQAACWLV